MSLILISAQTVNNLEITTLRVVLRYGEYRRMNGGGMALTGAYKR